MAKVFISHASADNELAAEVHGWLTAAGHEVFLDRDAHDGIELGDEWETRLRERLRWADAIVSLITTPYLQSIWCTFEITIARDRGSRVLPIIAEAGVRHPLLKALQYVDRAQARAVLTEVLGRIDAAGGRWPDDLSPFPGLESFDADRRRVFFGRAGDVNELVGRLRSRAEQALGSVLMVVGPSGCGKSSLVRAGVLPMMADEDDWLTVPPFRPGQDPIGELARRLAEMARGTSLGWTPSTVRELLAEQGLVVVADELLAATAGRRRRLLLVVDQFEELVVQTPPEQLSAFAGLLQAALSGPISVVATLRPEFLERVQVDPDLGGVPTAPYLVGPLRREALRGVIEGPADVAGIAVPDELIAAMVDDTSTGDALPLLAFTLEQLAEGIHRGGELSLARYRQLDGVQGALTRQAQIALRNAVETGGRGAQEVIDGLLRLVTVDESGQPTRWLRNRADLPESVAQDLDAFVERRLLTISSRGEGADHVVEISVTHEAFLSAWTPLRDAIAAKRDALRARRAVELAAAEWDEYDRPTERLWERGRLATAGNQLVDQVELSPTGRAFLRQSTTRDRRRRFRGTAILSVLLVLALTAAGVAVAQRGAAENQQSEAERQRSIAVARQLVAQAEIAAPSDPQTALRLALAADRIDPSARTRSGLVNTLLSTRYAGTLTGHTGGIGTPAFSADGRLMVTSAGDARVILWDISGSGQPKPIGEPLIYAGDNNLGGIVALSPDGRTLASSLQYPSGVILWDVSDPAHPQQRGGVIDPKIKQFARLTFTPDSKLLVVAGGFPATLSFWNATDASQVAAPFTIDHDVDGLWFFADSSVMVTATRADDFKQSVRRWDLRSPSKHAALGRPIAYKSAATFDPNRRLLATDGVDTFNSEVILRDLTNPVVPREVSERFSTIRSSVQVQGLTFSPDGHTLAIGSSGYADNSNAARFVDITNLADPRPYERPVDADGRPQSGGYSTGAENYVSPDHTFSRLVFLPGRPEVATISGDGSTRLWDLSERRLPRQIGEPITGGTGQGPMVAFLPDGRRLLTTRVNGPIVLWDITDAGTPRPAGPPLATAAIVNAVAFSRDGHTLSVAQGSSVTRFDLTAPVTPKAIGSAQKVSDGKADRATVFSPGGELVAVAGVEEVVVQDTVDPSRRTVLKKPFFPGKEGSGVPSDVTFSPDGRLLAIGQSAFASYLTLWDTSDPAKVHRVGEAFKPSDFASDVAFAATGPLLARTITGADGAPGVELWDLTDPAKPRQRGAVRSGHTDSVTATVISPDGKVLATGSRDRTVVLADISDPDHPVQLGLPLTPGIESLYSLAFSPDGRLLAAGGERGEVVLWDLADLSRPRALGEKLSGQVRLAGELAFAPDGRTLAVAGPASSSGGRVGLTDLSGLVELREHPTELACGRVGEGLNAAEWAQYVGELPYQQTC